ncbi:short-chain dehydrogenase [Xylaria bambusicola]|uniref:short-chain dehydrogenase n=1 Tax=Xylaria bambusicola TaxID=326684 RepID=UPI002008E640|nr:short-chain dehydrogenase [Xylaria bambusicola]KAI0521594.1 short-chain dehydrogenase [Xylaria bambusicola]
MAKYNKLAGKHIVVIGGTRGIGRGIVEASLESGARVTLAGSSQTSADTAVKSIKAEYHNTNNTTGQHLLGLSCDLSAQDSTESALETLLATAAARNGEVDHVVYTAADSLSLGDLQAVTPATALKAAHMRFLVPVLVGKVVERYFSRAEMKGRGDKSLVLTTGAIASKPAPGWSVIAYFAGGINALTRNLALDLAPVRVNAVEPGIVNTGLWDPGYASLEEREAGLMKMTAGQPVGRPGAVEEVVEAYMYLLRDANATGETVRTRGGQHLV